MEVDELLKQLEPLIQVKAKLANIPGMDWEDVAQELRIITWKQHKRLVNGLSKPETFANIIFNNKIKDLYKLTQGDKIRDWSNYDPFNWDK